MVTRSSDDSSEATISELADTFAQVEGDTHQRHIFKKLLAYTVITLWAGKHFISSKGVRKLRTYGSTARNIVVAADNVPSILLLAPPLWMKNHSEEKIFAKVSKLKQSAVIPPYLEKFEPLAKKLLENLERGLKDIELRVPILAVRAPSP
ncbi:hypothetical protein KCU62_g9458, partial [Aureobasidium sp. EXF-3399]